MRELVLSAGLDAAAFAPFGSLIARPGAAGERAMFSQHLAGAPEGCVPVFHTNFVKATRLPMRIDTLERHPHAAQAFIPLDLDLYVVVVAPTGADGGPIIDNMRGFLVPAHLGVIYGPGVWHAGASVVGRDGSFAVLMWRGRHDDDVLCPIPATRLIAPAAGTTADGLEVA